MAYIGAEPLPEVRIEVDDISSSFNGSTTAFTLSFFCKRKSESANNIIVSLGGVIQNLETSAIQSTLYYNFYDSSSFRA